jgi:hypothetical protein
MTDAVDRIPPGAASSINHSAPPRTRRRQGNTNIGYVLFLFGTIWVMAIAGMMAAAPK